METRASRWRARSPPTTPSFGRLLLFRDPSAGNNRTAVGAGDLRATHPVGTFGARRLSGRLDDHPRFERFRCPSCPGERRRGPELDLPFGVLAFIVGRLEIQERMRILEQESRD